MPADKEMGARIKALRRDCGMTQEQLALKLGNDGNTISRWERGEIGIGNKYLKELAAIFKVPVDYLLNGPEDRVIVKPQTTEPPAAAAKTEWKTEVNVIEKAKSERVGLDYWGIVVEVARAVAEKGDPSEIDDAEMMLDKALSSLQDARKKIVLPAAASEAEERPSSLPEEWAGDLSKEAAV